MMKGRILLLPFPFDDLSATKVRPAVCLTEFVGEHRHVVVAFVSSRVPPLFLDSDILIEEAVEDFAVTGLRVTSILRLHRLMTVTSGLIQRELGELPERLMVELDTKLKRLFELNGSYPLREVQR
ncbi:type II toxin-antitoxin system PemK/MazF family toxin [Candidatus Poribacteria bacterium]|nr:type II toxin-antitoxin system PemK/MazF family toxin [Candidatus Poribacteria bacterium]